MIKDMKVISRQDMENVVRFHSNNVVKPRSIGNFPTKDWYLISIHGGDELIDNEVWRILRKAGCTNYLSLWFDDITKEGKDINGVPYKLFDNDQAKKIVDFVDIIQNNEKDCSLVAHCHAGISRSGAVGEFVCHYCNLDYSKFRAEHPHIMPNPTVLSLLKKQAKIIPFLNK